MSATKIGITIIGLQLDYNATHRIGECKIIFYFISNNICEYYK